MKIMRLNREQVRIAKGLGVPLKPLTKEQVKQLTTNHEPNYWLLFIICTWLLLIVSIVLWK